MATVFLSYGRGDDEPFVERLCQALKARGLDVWFDRESMPSRSHTFHQEIRDAIAACERLVLVVGPHAVASEYVRQEWQFALNADKVVTPILRVGDYPLVPDELKLLHCEDFRDPDVTRSVSEEKVTRSVSEGVNFEFHLENLARQLSEPPPPLGKLIAVPSLPSHYLSRTERLQTLRNAVRADLDRPVVLSGETARVGMHGMGGIGKSVLASALVRDRLVREAFPDGIVWVGLGSLPTITELQRRVHADLGGDGAIATEHEGKTKLKELLADKSVLLVLDDVWRRSDADAFNVLGPRCRALITTRDSGLLTSLVGTHHLVELFTDGEALNLLAHAAGVAPDTLPSEAKEIVAECGRLPLAIALCGGMVQSGTPWRDVLDALREHDLEYIADEHVTEGQHRSLWVAMEVSLNALPKEPHDEQRRFAELAVFPEDTQIPEATVLTLWSHTGGLSERHARQLLVRLKQRSLVQINRAGDVTAQNVGDVSLHDLLRKFAIRLVEQRFGGLTNLHEQLLAAYQKKCPNGWPSGPNDGYFFKHLRTHFVAASRAPELADLLHDLRWLEGKNQAGLTFDLPFDFRAAIDALPKSDDHCRILRLLDETLRRDIHFIGRHAQDYPQALFQCLWNSGWWYDCPQAEQHYVAPVASIPYAASNARLHELLECWREQKQTATPGFRWLRTIRPPAQHLGSAQRTVLRGHEGEVTSVSFSPDGRRIVSGSSDKTVRVWDAESGAELCVLRGHEDSVSCVSYSPDGRRIVSGSWDKTIRIWDADSSAELCLLRGHTSEVTSVAYSPDGRRIASGAGYKTGGWHRTEGGFWAEDRTVGDKTVRVWDSDSGQELHVLRGHKKGVNSVSFSPDGRRIVSGSADERVRVWDANNGAKLRVLRGHEGSVTSVSYSPDGRRIVSGSGDATVRIWDADTGTKLGLFCGHELGISSVSFSPNGQRIVSGADDNKVLVWDADNGTKLQLFLVQGGSAMSVSFSPDGRRIVSGGRDWAVRVWDADSNVELRLLRGHEGVVSSVSSSPDGRRIVSGSGDKTVRVWDADSGGEVCVFRDHEDWVRCVSYSRDGLWIVSASFDKTVRVWDADSGAVLRVLDGHKSAVDCVSFAPDCRRIVSGGSDKKVRVSNAESGAELLVLSGHDDWVNCVSFSPDGQCIVSGSTDGTVRVWDADSGEELRVLREHQYGVSSVSFSPDGRRLVSSSLDQTVRVWDAASFECLEVITECVNASEIVRSLGCNPGPIALTQRFETVVLSADRKTALVWFPVSLFPFTAVPATPLWAGIEGFSMQIIRLEGGPQENTGS